MPERSADLHLHSNHSDGSDAPARVVQRAVEAGLDAIALTDHDTVSGVGEAAEAAQEHGLAFLTGTEISAEHYGMEVHILGLGIDTQHTGLLEGLAKLKDGRATRAQEIIARLNTLDVPVTEEQVRAYAANGAAIGRIHIARAVHALGLVPTVQGAFDVYIGAGKPAFISKYNLPCGDAVDLIHAAGGLAFLAHPGIGGVHKKMSRIFRHPFDGIEAYHTSHTPAQTERFCDVAHQRGLLITGGSDDHGHAKHAPDMGNTRLPWEHYERIREAVHSA